MNYSEGPDVFDGQALLDFIVWKCQGVLIFGD